MKTYKKFNPYEQCMAAVVKSIKHIKTVLTLT